MIRYYIMLMGLVCILFGCNSRNQSSIIVDEGKEHSGRVQYKSVAEFLGDADGVDGDLVSVSAYLYSPVSEEPLHLWVTDRLPHERPLSDSAEGFFLPNPTYIRLPVYGTGNDDDLEVPFGFKCVIRGVRKIVGGQQSSVNQESVELFIDDTIIPSEW